MLSFCVIFFCQKNDTQNMEPCPQPQSLFLGFDDRIFLKVCLCVLAWVKKKWVLVSMLAKISVADRKQVSFHGPFHQVATFFLACYILLTTIMKLTHCSAPVWDELWIFFPFQEKLREERKKEYNLFLQEQGQLRSLKGGTPPATYIVRRINSK